MRQQPPGAAGPKPVSEGIDELTPRVFGRTATRPRRWHQLREHHPLGIGQIRRIHTPVDHPRLPDMQ